MNNCFDWLKAKLERHPLLFVLIAGPVAYLVPIGLAAGGYAMGYRDAFYALLFAPVTVASLNGSLLGMRGGHGLLK